MNRFHLLSLEDGEDISVPVAANNPLPTPQVSPTKSSTNKTAPKAKPEKNSKFDRRSRGPRKGEGEKHQMVGKGSWGRPLDAAGMALEKAEVVGDAEVPEARNSSQTVVAPVQKKTDYKTVNEYLAEKEEQQLRLRARGSSANLRRANEGTEVEEMEIIKKTNDIFTVGSNPTAAKKTATPKESTYVKMTLQDLNKAVPLPKQREYRNRSGNPLSVGDRDQRSRREARSAPSDRPRNRNRENRSPNREFGRRPRTNTPKMNIKDESAFPCLA